MSSISAVIVCNVIISLKEFGRRLYVATFLTQFQLEYKLDKSIASVFSLFWGLSYLEANSIPLKIKTDLSFLVSASQPLQGWSNYYSFVGCNGTLV